MAVGTIHELGSLVIDDGATPVNLDGVESVTVDTGIQHFMETASGQADPSYIAVNSHDAQISASVTDIATALGIIGISGLEISSTATYNTVDAYFTQTQAFGTRASGSNHRRVRCSYAHVIPTKLSARQGSKATLDLEIHALYDGSNLPFVASASVALPHTPSVDELFTVGPGSINGSTLNGITGIDLDFGITLDKTQVEGDPYATRSYIQSRQPSLTITTLDNASLSTFGFSGTAQSASASEFYLRKVNENGTRVADGTAEHIKITVNASQGNISVSQISGSVGGRSESQIVIKPVVGSSAIIAISNASAIS